jgi:spoIIIJ-associated protein
VVSQAENAGTVASGDTAGQALAGESAGAPAGTGATGPGGPGPEDLDVMAEADVEDDVDVEDDADVDVEDDVEADVEDEDDAEDSAPSSADEAPAEVDLADLEQESEIAADYVEGLLDVADLDGDIDMDVEGDRALVSVVGTTLQDLVGAHGEVLEALQELTRLAVHRQTGARTRIMLDVGGYRARRRVELTELGRDAADEVKSSGVPQRLDAMTPFERKVVHDAVAAAGLRSESEGEEPNRRVVVFPVG